MRRSDVAVRIAALACLAFSVGANADLVSMDRSSPGDGEITLDTQTGLMWLDLALSAPNAIAFDNAFTADGWRVATLAQVQTLIGNHFGSSITTNARIPVALAPAQEFVELFGATFGDQISWGRFQGSSAAQAGQAIVRTDSGLVSYLIGDKVMNAAAPHTFSGVFYVQAVPLPPAALLFGSGLLGLIAGARGRRLLATTG